MEKLIEDNGIVVCPLWFSVGASDLNRCHPVESFSFKYHHRYFYDDKQLLIGDGGNSLMIEVETMASCVDKTEVTGKVTTEKIIETFKGKLKKYSVDINELVERFKSKNADIDPWKVNLLIH